MEIAVCLHLFHTDMFDDISKYLDNIKFNYDLFVGLVDGFYEESIKEKILSYKPDTKIIIVQNIGMDIGGFLQVYKHVGFDYSLVLKLHTKKGVGAKDKPKGSVIKFGYEEAAKIGHRWYETMMNYVLGSESKIETILKKFKRDPKCGMVGHKLYNNYNANISIMKSLFPLFGITNITPNMYFIGGTIFWFRNGVFKKYFTDEVIDYLLSISPQGYVQEPSINHAIERLFGIIVYSDDMEVKVV
jgi:rhamnosyltransferase